VGGHLLVGTASRSLKSGLLRSRACLKVKWADRSGSTSPINGAERWARSFAALLRSHALIEIQLEYTQGCQIMTKLTTLVGLCATCLWIASWVNIMKLYSDRKSLTKQPILMYKTAVYVLVNGGIAHQKLKISGKRSYYSLVCITLRQWHVE